VHSVAYDNDESNINNPKLVPATAPAFNLATAFNLFFIVVVVGSHMSPTYSLVVLVFFLLQSSDQASAPKLYEGGLADKRWSGRSISWITKLAFLEGTNVFLLHGSIYCVNLCARGVVGVCSGMEPNGLLNDMYVHRIERFEN